MTRDYSSLYHERSLTSTGCCRICGQPRTDDGMAAHAAHHLATAEAVVVGSVVDGALVWRVEPTSAQRPIVDKPLRPRPLDPKLRAIVRRHLRNQKARAQ